MIFMDSNGIAHFMGRKGKDFFIFFTAYYKYYKAKRPTFNCTKQCRPEDVSFYDN